MPFVARRAATSARPEKNAGLTYYANGSALPGAAAFRVERDRRYERCRALANERFPAHAAIDGLDAGRLRKLCSAKG